MAKDIWLYEAHRNFIVGKIRLKKAVVFETNFYYAIFWLVIALLILWLSAAPLRQEITFWRDGQATTGVVTDCEQETGKGSHTTVSYRYSIEGQNYSAQDMVSYGIVCEQYPSGSLHPVYYLSTTPESSGIDAYVHFDEWIPMFIYGGASLVGIFAIFTYMLKNRGDAINHARLQNSGILIEGRVMELGTSHANKTLYLFANYQFEVPLGHYLKNRIESRKNYPYPKDIQVGDSLHILYMDDKTYCVL